MALSAKRLVSGLALLLLASVVGPSTISGEPAESAVSSELSAGSAFRTHIQAETLGNPPRTPDPDDRMPVGTTRRSDRVSQATMEAALRLKQSSPQPRVFNASATVKGGDIAFVQGANIDATTVVYSDGSDDKDVYPIVARVSDTWIAVQLPPLLKEPLVLRLKSEAGVSEAIKLNAAKPWHIDATRISPGAKFRIFGRNLKTGDHQPGVYVSGRPAVVDVAESTETMLVATVPADVPVGTKAALTVDNGNGTGPSDLPAEVQIDGGSGDPLGLDVPWAAGFDFAGTTVDAGVKCDGETDDSFAIEDAIKRAASRGGGVVRLPPGTCVLEGTINMKSRTVLRGSGRQQTRLVYKKNYPISAENCDLLGLQDLTLTNYGASEEGISWKSNTRSFIQNTTLEMKTSRQWFLTSNRDFLFDHNEISQEGSYNQQNPYRFDESSGLIFSNNRSINVAGSPTFQTVHDSVFSHNHFSRNASSQHERPVVVHHQFVVDFSYRISIVDNVFDVVNGPITAVDRNDGETILVEGGGPFRTESAGVVNTASSDGIDDPERTDTVDQATGLSESYAIAIVSGHGKGQVRRVTAVSGSSITVDRPWDVVPEPGSHYATFIWGLRNALIEGNVLRDNPRGIWLYSSSVDNVAILGNQISDGGGIFLRSFQKQDWSNIQMNVDVDGNTISNATGRWMSHIIVANVRSDKVGFGIGELGISVRRNRIVAHVPNVVSRSEDHAAQEGYAALVYAEGGDGQLGTTPEILGPIFQGNVCVACEQPYVTGTGVYGGVFADNKVEPEGSGTVLDLKMFDNRAGGSIGLFTR